jgi:hypothetical protein
VRFARRPADQCGEQHAHQADAFAGCTWSEFRTRMASPFEPLIAVVGLQMEGIWAIISES